jgi:hypothetical protein
MEIFSGKQFDYAVYGGSVKGVLTAARLAKQNAKVLLINKYGFLGGAISENLTIMQNLSDINFHDSILKCDDLFYQSDIKNNKFINPEQIKFALQDLLLEHNIEPIFHVSPISIKNNEITLSGKEGLLTVKTDNILDCSDNLYLEYLEKNVIYKKGFYFLTIKGDDKKIDLNKIINPLFVEQISATRYFAGFEIKFADILEVEIIAHELVSKITDELTKIDYRIELLPVSTYLLPEILNKPKFELLSNFTIPFYNEILKNSLNYEQLLNKNYE